MVSEKVASAQVELAVENVGGIDESQVTFEPGITVLTGRNATNRTSLLQAIMAGLGSDRVSLKGDADCGRVSMSIGDAEYTRTLERQGDGVAFGGDPYLEDARLADLFAFLLNTNEARRTVEFEGGLRDVIMDPVDADAIQAEISRLRSERERLEDEMADLRAREEALENLRDERDDLAEELEDKRAVLAEKREELEERSTTPDDARSEQTAVAERMEALEEARSDLDTTEFRLESERESLESLRSERTDLEQRYEAVAGDETGDLEAIESEIDRKRDRKQRLESELNRLQNVIQFNEEMLEGASRDIASTLRGESEEGGVADRLVEPDDAVVCWTCGSEVDQETIEETLDRLRDLRQSKYVEQGDLEDDLADLKAERSSIQSIREEREEVQNRLASVREEIDRREQTVRELEDRREELGERVSALEDEIAGLQADEHSAVLDAQSEVNRLELEIERLVDRRESVDGEIEDAEAAIDEIDRLATRREQISEQLTELRTRIDRIEEQAIEGFNEHMATLLDILDYDNIDRIWVERVATDTGGGRGPDAEFRLHVVRSTGDDVVYEDDLQHLSESERAVTGVVFALAGYLAHDVHEVVPFILLDSLEAIDAERIATLVEYVAEFADYLVVALLEEDAAALDDAYDRITDI